MKKNVYRGTQRVRCNTETARLIVASKEDGLYLYRTSHGDFFMHATHGPFTRERPKRCQVDEEIFLIQKVDAQKFCRKHMKKGDYEYLFEEKGKDSGPGRQPVTITLPGGVVRRLDAMAKRKGVSRGRLIEDAILVYERVAGKNDQPMG